MAISTWWQLSNSYKSSSALSSASSSASATYPIYIVWAPWKSASASPRGWAGNLADSYRRSIRIVLIDYQSKRRDVWGVGAATSCWWRGEFFRREGEPQRKLQKWPLPYVRTSNLRLEITASTSGVPPSSRTAYDYNTRHLHDTAGRPNEPHTPRKVCDEPLIPHPTRQPGLTAVFRPPLYLNPPSYILVLLAA